MSDHTAKLTMGRVALTVHDLDAVGAFYEHTVGLHRLSQDGESARYGTPTDTLIELRRDPDARRRSPREAGLFHTALLLPTRADLARWTHNAAARRTPVVGASDHAVSEAIYLTDPEGNGVEIYIDRPQTLWPRQGDSIAMTTEALDVADLLDAAGGTPWTGFPEGATVGHVHLQVGALAPAEAFFGATLGLDVTCRYPGATFFAADGYHHHLATNIWNSRGADARSFPATGLADVEIRLDPTRAAAIRERAGVTAGAGLTDPWGTPFTLTAV